MQQTLLRASDRFGVDAYLIKAVIHAESAFNPHAVSPKNAIGLMQVLPGTAREMGLHERDNMSVEQLLKDPRVSIVVGTRYLSEQLQRFGSTELALAAYNAGPGAVQRSGNRVPNYPETQAYIQRVKELRSAYSRARSLASVSQQPALPPSPSNLAAVLSPRAATQEAGS
jgi:soluble lytic murein transglycosylase-like protein